MVTQLTVARMALGLRLLTLTRQRVLPRRCLDFLLRATESHEEFLKGHG